MKTLIAILALLISPPAPAQDACALPNALETSVAAAFPGFRVPVVTDNLPEDVQWNLEHKGNGCLGVASADFDGNGTKDYVVGLTALNGPGSAVVVALLRSGKWQLRQLSA